MRRYGPLFTLLAGGAVAAVLLALSVNASRSRTPQNPLSAKDTAGAGTVVAAETTAPAPAVAPPPPSPAVGQSTFAGKVNGGGATIAVAVHDGQAIAYLCDGRRIEVWLRGTAVDGALTLAGDNGATLTGGYAASGASGAVTAAGKHWSFRVSVVTAPSGLYRATANVRGALARMGWIVLADLSVVGVMSVGTQEPEPAPPFDPATGSATVNGTAVRAVSVDGVTGSGF